MVATLLSLATEISEETDRPDRLEDIKTCIRRVLMEARRNLYWFSERRMARIDLVAGQQWYGSWAALSPERFEDLSSDASSRLYEGDAAAADSYPWSWDSADLAGGTVLDLQQVHDARLVRSAETGRWYPLACVREISEFNAMSDRMTESGPPEYYCRYSGEIGFWPIPDAADVARFWGNFRPIVPAPGAAGDSTQSIFFDEAENWIRTAAKAMLFAEFLRDAEEAQRLSALALGFKENIDAESNRRQRTEGVRLADAF